MFHTCPDPSQPGRGMERRRKNYCRFLIFSLLNAIRPYDPAATPAKLLRPEFEATEDMEMPIVWFTAQTLLYIWGVRLSGRVVDLVVTRTLLETKINLLRETRFRNEQILIKEILEQFL